MSEAAQYLEGCLHALPLAMGSPVISDYRALCFEYRALVASLLVETGNLSRRLDDAVDTLRRVVANESNHYDRYWTPVPEPLTQAWLDETKANMREGLEDAFCDDAAAIMLTLIAEIERLRPAGCP